VRSAPVGGPRDGGGSLMEEASLFRMPDGTLWRADMTRYVPPPPKAAFREGHRICVCVEAGSSEQRKIPASSVDRLLREYKRI